MKFNIDISGKLIYITDIEKLDMRKERKMRFKRCRENKGLTQTEAAEILHVSQSTVSMWETGCNLPRVEKLKEISRLYGCTVDDLLRDDSETDSQK